MAKKKEINISELVQNMTGKQMQELVSELPLFPLATHITMRLAHESIAQDMEEVDLTIDPEIDGVKYDVTLRVTVKPRSK